MSIAENDDGKNRSWLGDYTLQYTYTVRVDFLADEQINQKHGQMFYSVLKVTWHLRQAGCKQ